MSVNETPRGRRSRLEDEPASPLQLAGELLWTKAAQPDGGH
jgi:hypothetical protein